MRIYNVTVRISSQRKDEEITIRIETHHPHLVRYLAYGYAYAREKRGKDRAVRLHIVEIKEVIA